MNQTPNNQAMDPIITGPIFRKIEADRIHLWLATSAEYDIQIPVFHELNKLPSTTHNQVIKVGKKLYINFISVTLDQPLPQESALAYDIELSANGIPIELDISHLSYDKSDHLIQFIWKPNISSILHGSCRKSHYGYQKIDSAPSIGDGLAQADQHLASTPISEWPSLLMLSGDQIYADDVSGPMLYAIRQCVQLLGIEEGTLPTTEFKLINDTYFYHREALLPHSETSEEVRRQFFKGKKKPVFTTDTAHNHLISLAEVICMYLLVWSPTLWRYISLEQPKELSQAEHITLYEQEKQAIQEFVQYLPNVQRTLAHLPTAMMFDDHDVTDDWNLTADWEQTAYENPLSKYIIGNALFGYFLCQAWGNTPDQFDEDFIQQAQTAVHNMGESPYKDFIDTLFHYDKWHYQWNTFPKLVVLDTRTHRWRSENNFNHPSGLMDWEAITDLQHEIKNQESVILVSPAPIFGVKLIESIQKVFTWFGKPLMVDAENWMAHPGSAHALLNLFTHPKTPSNFVILSGDVHYSFAYDIKLRGIKSSPNIWQITSSGLRNEFPHRLLEWFDRLNRWLYAPWSPLNIFTKRRSLHVSPRKPEHASRGERLLNHAGIGFVSFNKQGQPTNIAQLCNDQQVIHFLPSNEKDT